MSYFENTDPEEVIRKLKEMSDENFKNLAIKAALLIEPENQDGGDGDGYKLD